MHCKRSTLSPNAKKKKKKKKSDVQPVLTSKECIKIVLLYDFYLFIYFILFFQFLLFLYLFISFIFLFIYYFSRWGGGIIFIYSLSNIFLKCNAGENLLLLLMSLYSF